MPFPVLALAAGTAVVGGLLSGSSASKQNRYIKQAAEANMVNVDKQITQTRIRFLDETAIASAALQRNVGAARAAGSGVGQGRSFNQFIAQQLLDGTTDQIRRSTNAAATVDALQSSKQSIASQANSQTQSPLVATAQGALSGFSTGLAIGQGIESLQQAADAAKVADGQVGLLGQQRELIGLQTQGARDYLDFQRQWYQQINQQFGQAQQIQGALQRSPYVVGQNPWFLGGGR